MSSSSQSSPRLLPREYIFPFVLTTACFSLWGFANDFTNPLVKVFEQAKLGSAFLIMSIVGGALLTKLQGELITHFDVRTSFWLPAGCFIIIAFYGLRCCLTHDKDAKI